MNAEQKKSIVAIASVAGMGLCFVALFFFDEHMEVVYVALALMVAIPSAGMVALWRLGERFSEFAPQLPIPETPTPVHGGIHWLEVLPEFTKRFRKGALIMLVVVACIAVATLYVFETMLKGLPVSTQLLFVAVFAFYALVPAAMLVRPPRAWRTRLGTDGKQLLIDLGDGKVRGYPFEALLSDGRQLLAGRKLIPLRLGYGRQPLFDEKELAGYILSRIPPSNRVHALELSMRALRTGNRETRWGIVALVIVFALIALSELFPEVSSEVRKAALDLFFPK